MSKPAACKILVLIYMLCLLTSCSFSRLLDPLAYDGGNTEEGLPNSDDTDLIYRNYENEINDFENSDYENDARPVANIADDIELTLNTSKPGTSEPDTHTAVPPASRPVHMEIKLYFADMAYIEKGTKGAYGYVTPVIRKVPATSGILKAAMDELIKGPLPEEADLSPVLPASAKVNGAKIADRIAIIDFSNELISDHSGGSLGGTIAMQALVFTACQFDSIDGVLVTVEGNPWDEGHFVWDTPIYEQELLSSIRS